MVFCPQNISQTKLKAFSLGRTNPLKKASAFIKKKEEREQKKKVQRGCLFMISDIRKDSLAVVVFYESFICNVLRASRSQAVQLAVKRARVPSNESFVRYCQ